MLTMDLGTLEYYDGENNEFVYEDIGIVRFEYTLKVLYDWEEKWKKPFIENDELNAEETLDMYRMMALDPIKDEVFTDEVLEKLALYISDTNTATTFSSFGESDDTVKRGKAYTAEEIYALMISANVPLEFENRNLNRLLVILKIIASYNNPPKKMSQEEILRRNRELNRQRKEQYKTKG